MQSESKEKIRVLIADDSLFMRTYLSALLRADPEIAIVGTASSGDEVVLLALELKPDVITMDYHMPGKNGIDAAAAIMRGGTSLPAIIMLSAFSGIEGERAREMLESTGAHVIVKPSGEVSLDIEKISIEIIKKIKEVGHLELIMQRARRGIAKKGAPHNERHVFDKAPFGVVVIGASTGGPPLIEHLLTLLDPAAPQSVVIVQHMSEYFTELFAERLDRVSGFRVREAVEGDILEAGVALVVPGGHMLVPYPRNVGVCAFTVKLIPDESREVMIDNTMKAIAECHKEQVVGVLLSGMGRDGTEGLRAIHAHGGLSLVQDPHTATVSAMPNNALSEGVAKEILNIDDIPSRIATYFARIHA